MNVWTFDDEPVVSRPRVKKTCFADEAKVSTSDWGSGDTKSQRRKQRAKVEFLVEDQEDSEDAGEEDSHRKRADDSSTGTISAKTSQSVLQIFHTTKSASTTEQPARSSQEMTVHHLVREFLLMHCYDDVVGILDQERPIPLLGAAEIKQLSRRLTGTDKTSANSAEPSSLLERFLVCSNEAKLKTRAKRSAKQSPQEAAVPSCGRTKPILNVITSNLSQTADSNGIATPVGGQTGDYNRLNHPGSTPHHVSAVIGEPGSTPMARTKDLHLFGFDDANDNEDNAPPPGESTEGNSNLSENTDQLSRYALQKRSSNTGLKHVQLGDPGRTPTKEYIFFRETPPSFVTETIEDAVDIFEKLGNDPEFAKQAVAVERYVELQSGEVSKYKIGAVIEGLGPQSSISGVVSKVYGSRLCGTAGPGSIVIDTCPQESVVTGN
ncbi:hypothetical protein P3T76_003559 [Phytophthora citrophthora]|uniref:Uncharacterized protein n=1 Tax=Phytophthora citrophthora TaxID=4793 RepID=A0AAD9GUX0_9STRA|nr:hypothetical protein P3T76_003559 [Phytophthora citrophthora]